MKKIILIIFFTVRTLCAYCQSENFNSLLILIDSVKDDTKRLELINNFFDESSQINPLTDIQNSQKLLLHAQKGNDKIAESISLAKIGHDYRVFGNTAKGLEYTYKALEIAEQTNNLSLLSTIKHNLGNIYKDREDYPRAINYYLYEEEAGLKLKDYETCSDAQKNLGAVYLLMGKLDSALMYSQRSYELALRIGKTDNLSYTFTQLGGVNSKLGNGLVAVGYFNLAVSGAIKTKYPRELNWAYMGLAEHYYVNKQIDSSAFYAKKSIEAVQNTAFYNMTIKPAKLLAKIYRNTNSDSALKYYEIYTKANDSLFSTKASQQTQLITFENELRQNELFAEKKKTEDQRKQNIQFALIAIGIVSFIILYLLLSHSFITNTKVIEFFGVIALLIVFEFLNLFLHPYLDRYTDHSPVLMLFILVCLAAILVPLHHRVEKWATKKLVEKNKQVRLANAKKTIRLLSDEKLGNNNL